MCQALTTYVPWVPVCGGFSAAGLTEGERRASAAGSRIPAQPIRGGWLRDLAGQVQGADPRDGGRHEPGSGGRSRPSWTRGPTPARPGSARGRRPDYLIVATNVPLSGVPGSGGKARIDKLIDDGSAQIGLKDWRVWDGAQITAFLSAYPDVRRAFAALITPSEVLAQMRDRLDTPPEVSVVLSIPAAAIRPGQPGCEAAFTAVYNAAAWRGAARAGARRGLRRHSGWVQHFTGSPSGEPAVICALHGRTAITVAESIWNEVCAIGGGHPGVAPQARQASRSARGPDAPFIGRASEEVELAGGQWGPGPPGPSGARPVDLEARYRL